MLRLRPYKACDAKTVLSWIENESAFYKWSAGRLGVYPITDEDLNRKYLAENGDCPECDHFYPMTAFDEDGVAGHLIMRFTDDGKTVLRFGFIIVDNTRRSKGYGKEMLTLALRYAYDILKAKKVTLGVFDCNPSARHCYERVGFVPTGEQVDIFIRGEAWIWHEMEYVKEKS